MLKSQEKSRNFANDKVTTFSVLNTIMTFKDYWQNYELLSEGKKNDVNLGIFPFVAHIIQGGGPIILPLSVVMKGRSKHNIHQLAKYTTDTLNNFRFAELYKNNIYSFYGEVTKSNGTKHPQKVGIDIKKKVVLTAHTPNLAQYQQGLQKAQSKQQQQQTIR